MGMVPLDNEHRRSFRASVLRAPAYGRAPVYARVIPAIGRQRYSDGSAGHLVFPFSFTPAVQTPVEVKIISKNPAVLLWLFRIVPAQPLHTLNVYFSNGVWVADLDYADGVTDQVELVSQDDRIFRFA